MHPIASVCIVAPGLSHIVTTASCFTHSPFVSSGNIGPFCGSFQLHFESWRKMSTGAPPSPSVFTSYERRYLPPGTSLRLRCSYNAQGSPDATKRTEPSACEKTSIFVVTLSLMCFTQPIGRSMPILSRWSKFVIRLRLSAP